MASRRCSACGHQHMVGPAGEVVCGGDRGQCECDPSEPENAPPGAANAARRVYRRETEVRGWANGANDLAVFASDGARWDVSDIVPAEAVPALRKGGWPRGRFTVTVEFTVDE